MAEPHLASSFASVRGRTVPIAFHASFSTAVTGGASLGGGAPDSRAAIERAREVIRDMRFAPVIPVIARVAVDGADRIWVQRTGSTIDSSGPIDIVTPAGEYVGTIPPGASMPDAFGPDGRVAYVRTDEPGEQRVEVGRLTVRQVR